MNCCLLVELPFQCFDVLALERQGKLFGGVYALRLEEEHHFVSKGVGIRLEGHLVRCQPDSGTKFIFVEVDDRVTLIIQFVAVRFTVEAHEEVVDDAPGLGLVVPDVFDLESGLFHDFPPDAIFQCLADLRKAGNQRIVGESMTCFRGVLGQEDLVLVFLLVIVSDRDDDCRQDARVNGPVAFRADERTLSGAVDAIASVHADHKMYLQQCYANLDYQKTFFLEIGSREEKPVLRDDLLSSGSFVKGTNAKPIPQIHFGTNDFWTVPFTKDWLQINFDFGYGKFMDSSYREDRYMEASDVNLMYTTGAFYHQKHLYFRTNPKKRIFVTAGIQHVAQFGGTNYNKEDDTTKKKPANLKAMWNVVLPLGDNNYYDDEALEDWIYGNHLGLMTIQLGWNINEQHQVQVYYDDIFEDGSGMRKSNGWDGLWGVEYKSNRALYTGTVAIIRSLYAVRLQTKCLATTTITTTCSTTALPTTA